MRRVVIDYTNNADLNFLTAADSEKQNEEKQNQKELHPVFEEILNSFQSIYSGCRRGG